MLILINYVMLFALLFGNGVNDPAENNIGYNIGNYPPPLELRDILGERSIESLTWEKLRGNVVIVDFWATWCIPCIETIPHINGLVEKYKDKPVTFISMAYEPDVLVLPFFYSWANNN